MKGTKYDISQHTLFTVAISTERINCIQLNMQQRLLLLFKTFKLSIYALIIVVHHRFINLALNILVLTLTETLNWQL